MFLHHSDHHNVCRLYVWNCLWIIRLYFRSLAIKFEKYEKDSSTCLLSRWFCPKWFLISDLKLGRKNNTSHKHVSFVTMLIKSSYFPMNRTHVERSEQKLISERLWWRVNTHVCSVQPSTCHKSTCLICVFVLCRFPGVSSRQQMVYQQRIVDGTAQTPPGGRKTIYCHRGDAMVREGGGAVQRVEEVTLRRKLTGLWSCCWEKPTWSQDQQKPD